ncbi:MULTISPECIES: hypothetical protein [unclassified Streptomyces]|uniref:hypothetical protein n=1 Tax=unclassified Streptomyces TaxID=2593676 RepID=UPI003D724731
MGTAERREALESGTMVEEAAPRDPAARDRCLPAGDRGAATSREAAIETGDGTVRVEEQGDEPSSRTSRDGRERGPGRPLWVEEPARHRRMPDPVRNAAVRSVLLVAVTLVQAMVALLCTLAGSWPAFPMVISSVASTVAATWAVLDVWVTRQVWKQRNGVVSTPSSTARALRRERRRVRRQERAAARAQGRIRGRGGAGQLSHP